MIFISASFSECSAKGSGFFLQIGSKCLKQCEFDVKVCAETLATSLCISMFLLRKRCFAMLSGKVRRCRSTISIRVGNSDYRNTLPPHFISRFDQFIPLKRGFLLMSCNGKHSLPDGSESVAQWIFNEVNLDFYSLPEEFSTIRQCFLSPFCSFRDFLPGNSQNDTCKKTSFSADKPHKEDLDAVYHQTSINPGETPFLLIHTHANQENSNRTLNNREPKKSNPGILFQNTF
ncbi:Uncharacterised protein [Porphyromonas macacae]|uniref:Uncharacterized protein n=1 Tax=Porphyromonas macacae TaxID=28115 RepID=A0A379E819_9PORP|nr:Uncharacterised protein [Porphyromonas macacae]